jgi:thiamine-phosphate pyrophosphorylase
VLLRDGEARDMHRVKADGLHLSSADGLSDIRQALKSESLGFFAATSRHMAMEAAEAGADYVAFAQKSQFAGEPLLAWWHDIFEVPAVAFDPVNVEDLALLLPQKPDFIRPSDEMWLDAQAATNIISALSKGMA